MSIEPAETRIVLRFACPHCPRSFTSRSGRSNHIGRSHRRQVVAIEIGSLGFPLEPDGTILIENLQWIWRQS